MRHIGCRTTTSKNINNYLKACNGIKYTSSIISIFWSEKHSRKGINKVSSFQIKETTEL
jgi:hypothetical protein